MTIQELQSEASKNGFYAEFDTSVSSPKLVVRDASDRYFVNICIRESEAEVACDIVSNTMKEKKLWL